jgi:3-phenylpropionate/cinnamic acid dioxygenase small subunit
VGRLLVSDAVRDIENLIYRYAERMDAGDFAGVARLFDGATYRAAQGPTLTGSAELEAVLRAVVKLYDGRPSTRHVTTNVTVELGSDGAIAAARSYFTVFQSLPDFPLQAIVAGAYADRFTHTNGRWRFVERVVSMDLLGDLSRHLTAHFARSR